MLSPTLWGAAACSSDCKIESTSASRKLGGYCRGSSRSSESTYPVILVVALARRLPEPISPVTAVPLWPELLFRKLLAPAGSFIEHFGETLSGAEVLADRFEDRDQLVDRGTNLVGVGGGDVLPDVRRARGEACRVREPSAGQHQTFGADVRAHALHQRARGHLRQVTEERHQSIVRIGRHRLRPRAERLDERAQTIVPAGQQPRPALEEIGTRVLEPAACRAGQRVAADEDE